MNAVKCGWVQSPARDTTCAVMWLVWAFVCVAVTMSRC